MCIYSQNHNHGTRQRRLGSHSSCPAPSIPYISQTHKFFSNQTPESGLLIAMHGVGFCDPTPWEPILKETSRGIYRKSSANKNH